MSFLKVSTFGKKEFGTFDMDDEKPKTKKRKETPKKSTPKKSAPKKEIKRTTAPSLNYTPTKYQKPLKGKGKFNVVSHLEDLHEDYVLQESEIGKSRKEVLFPEWNVKLNDIKFPSKSEAKEYMPCAINRARVYLKSNLETPNSKTLIEVERFDGWYRTDTTGFPLGIRNNLPSLQPSNNGVDIILNTGGPVWAIEWCPSLLTREEQLRELRKSYIAISSYKAYDETHVMGQTYHGKNMIQIWDLGAITTKGVVNPSNPILALGILHDKCYVRAISWCKKGSKYDVSENEVPRLGLLAACFGDGSMDIYAVPDPESLSSQIGLESDSPIYVRLKPVFTLPPDVNAMICTVSWSHHGDCSRIAVGYSDGRVSVWELSDKQNDISISSVKSESLYYEANYIETPEDLALSKINLSAVPIVCFKAHNSYIQKVCWSPENSNYLSTCSMSSSVKVWDIRMCAAPVDNQQTQGGITNDLAWDRQLNTLVTCLDDGGIRLIASDITKKFDYHNCFIWGVDTSPFLRFLASCDVNGSVVVLPLIPSVGENRNHRKLKNQESVIDRCEVFIKEATQTAILYASNEASIEINELETLQTPTKKTGKETPQTEPKMFPEPLIALHKVKWNPNINASNWIAYGGCFGIVRIQLLRWLEP